MNHIKKTKMKEKNDNLIINKNLNNIKNKKIKFAFTFLLIVFSLLLISISDALTHLDDSVIKKHAQLLVDKNEQFVQIEKYKIENDRRDANIQELTEDDIIKINQKLMDIGKKGINIYQVGNLHIPSNKVMTYKSIYDVLEISPYSTLRKPYIYSWDRVDIVEWNDFENFFIDDIIGRVPCNYDEIMISNRLASLLIREGLKPSGEDNYYKPANYEELVTSNKYFYFGDADKVKIVGIINYDLSQFESLKNLSWNEYSLNFEKYSVILDELSYKDKNIYNKIFVNNEFVNHLNVNDPNRLDNIWQKKMTKTGILVMENKKNGFEKLLNEFRHDEPLIAKSTYSEVVDSMMDFQRLLSTESLFSNILFCLIIVLVISCTILISRFTFSKQEDRKSTRLNSSH